MACRKLLRIAIPGCFGMGSTTADTVQSRPHAVGTALVAADVYCACFNVVPLSGLYFYQQVVIYLAMVFCSDMTIALFSPAAKYLSLEQVIMDHRRQMKSKASSGTTSRPGSFAMLTNNSVVSTSQSSEAGPDDIPLQQLSQPDPVISIPVTESVNIEPHAEGHGQMQQTLPTTEPPTVWDTLLAGPGANPAATLEPVNPVDSTVTELPSPQPTENGWIARNSEFVGPTPEEREDLYLEESPASRLLLRSMVELDLIFGAVGTVPVTLMVRLRYPHLAAESGVDPTWAGIFMAASATTNTGLNLLDAGVTKFDDDPVPLLLLTILIAGATSSSTPAENSRKTKAHQDPAIPPRPPSTATDRFAAKWSRAKRALMGYFTTISNRHAGMLLMPLTEVNSAYWPVVYIFTLIGIWPYAITLRNSNVLQERSLGHSMPIYAGDNRNRDHPGLVARIAQTFMPRSIQPSNTGWNLIYEQLAAQQSYGALNFVFFSTVLVFIEGIQKVDDPARWFKLLFEAGSAYAGTGMSMPADGSSTSLSAEFNVGGKLTIMYLMFMGRHRGLPVALDFSIHLSSDELAEAEEDDGRAKQERIRARARALLAEV
ncbi:Putative cation transporter [Septoria linicola]|uniref:Cation transporter n=1 Tax=Septoria linicola TaxID=215465 RepID=A0A9Q9AK17_9PEZI|nr:putative cation transporter [Septoria linicola]USW50764.1 Putative cation transporter [Septoria linicola]